MQLPTLLPNLLSTNPSSSLSLTELIPMTFLLRFLPVLDLSCFCSSADANQPVYARKAMVVAQEPLAADVGLEVLKSGGNAVDAAVAVGFALSVTYPFAGNIGGGGFMLVRM